MLKRALELKGYGIIEASDGLEALNIVKRRCPSLIVIDLNMPELDGLETIKRIRALQGARARVPIVAITAFDVYGMEEATLETGGDRYLTKPFKLEDLDKTLRSLGFIA